MNMRNVGCITLGLTLFALLDGFVLGIFAGLFAQPSQVEASLQFDPDEYLSLVSVAYALDNDLLTARKRLTALQIDTAQLPEMVVQAAQRASARRDTARAKSLEVLARSLGAEVPSASGDVVQASALTPVPTFTATPTAVAPQALPVQAAAPVNTPTSTPSRTPTVTPTRTRTPIPLPTRTRTPTPTRRPPTRTPTPAPISQPQPPPSPTPSVDYKVKLVRQLTACENGGNHHLFMLVLDQNGNGIPNVWVEVVWSSGSFRDYTGKKVEYIPSLGVNSQTTAGYLNYPMYKGSYRARVMDGVSEQTGWLTVDIPRDEYCAATDNPIGNSLYHYSYLIVFQKVR